MFNHKLTPLAMVAAVGLSMSGVTFSGAFAKSYSSSIPEIEWDTTLTTFQFDNDKFIGQRFTAKCMPANAKDMDAVVYGTDTYPSNNSICMAAAGAARVKRRGTRERMGLSV